MSSSTPSPRAFRDIVSAAKGSAATYAHSNGVPANTRDSRQHTCGGVREDEAEVSLWSLSRHGESELTVCVAPAFGSHDNEFVLLWGLPGINFAGRSEWRVSADLAAERLVRVLPDWNLLDADIVTILNPRTIRTVPPEALMQDLISAFSGRGWV
jgi:hypothetical protein